MRVKVIILMHFGVATNHADCEETGWIIVCLIEEEDDEKFPCKSIYDQRLAKVTSRIGRKYWILRVKLNKEGDSLMPYNEITESTLFKDEVPNYLFEFAKNKLLVSDGAASHMYLVVDWCVVKCIFDPITANTYKTYAFLLPGFNEESFPFIAVCGQYHISILNIATLEHKPLTIGMTSSGFFGLRFAFAMGDTSEIQLHFVLTVQDKEGSGKELIQYSYITLGEDAVLFLK